MIRAMNQNDLAKCGEIYAKVFPAEYWGIGCVFALCRISGSGQEIYINEMAVRPDRQGQGTVCMWR